MPTIEKKTLRRILSNLRKLKKICDFSPFAAQYLEMDTVRREQLEKDLVEVGQML